MPVQYIQYTKLMDVKIIILVIMNKNLKDYSVTHVINHKKLLLQRIFLKVGLCDLPHIFWYFSFHCLVTDCHLLTFALV